MISEVQKAKCIIQYFNSKKSTCFRFADKNIEAITTCLALGYSEDTLISAISVCAAKDLLTLFSLTYLKANGFFPVLPEVPECRATPDAPERVRAQASLNILEEAMARIFTETQADKIADRVLNAAEEKIREFVRENYGDLPRKTVVTINDIEVKFEEVLHDQFETILAFVQMNEPVFITGPAGSGKNVLCKQIAKALNLKFYFSNAITQEYKITGFTDAMGVFQQSQFYQAFSNGGLFMLDELDASIPEAAIIMNAAIANRYFDFPAPIGYVEAHPDFRIIAAGNTFGTGASYQYVGRNQLDGATLDRFSIVEVHYSKRVEDSVCIGNMELADFCRDFRKAAEKAGTQVIVSYRAISRMAKMEKLLPLGQMMKTCLLKGLERDDLKMISGNMEIENKYRAELNRIAGERA